MAGRQVGDSSGGYLAPVAGGRAFLEEGTFQLPDVHRELTTKLF